MTSSNGMKLTVIAAHPNVTMVESEHQRIEVPTDWFQTRPRTGQTWKIHLEHELSDHEKIERLNAFLGQA